MPRVIITIPDRNPQPYRFQLDRKVVSLGRGSDNDIVIESGSVSVRHAEMHRVEGGYELADLGSTNGIKYDGSRHEKIALHSGMSLRLGDVTFDFTLSEEELEALGREKPAADSPITREPEIEAPRKEAKKPASPKPAPGSPAKAPEPVGVGIGMIILFLLLAATAFFAGLSIRHQKETGESLIKAIVNKGDLEEEAPAAGGPAE